MVGQILATTLASLLVGSAVAKSNDNFPDIPQNHWAYEDMAQFRRDGLVRLYEPLFRGGAPPSRAEFADRVEYVFEKMLVLTGTAIQEIQVMSSPTPKNEEWLAKNRRWAAENYLPQHLSTAKHANSWRDPMHRLIKEFAPDLRRIAINADELQRRSDDLIATCEQLKMPVSGTVTHPPSEPGGARIATKWFEDIPDNHWAFEDLAYLKKRGLIEPWNERPAVSPTRADIAVATQQICSRMLSDRWSLQLTDQTSAWSGSVRRLLTEFAPDLSNLCVDVSAMCNTLDSAISGLGIAANATIGQFADVPHSHWAAQATLDLRRAGILVGYPDGQFRG